MKHIWHFPQSFPQVNMKADKSMLDTNSSVSDICGKTRVNRYENGWKCCFPRQVWNESLCHNKTYILLMQITLEIYSYLNSLLQSQNILKFTVMSKTRAVIKKPTWPELYYTCNLSDSCVAYFECCCITFQCFLTTFYSYSFSVFVTVVTFVLRFHWWVDLKVLCV